MLLRVEYATKYYSHAVALENVRFDARSGEVIGIFGANASGKSTLLRSIAGMQALSYGYIKINGKDVRTSDAISLITNHGSYFPEQTAAEHAKFYHHVLPSFNKKRFFQLISYFQLPENRPIAHFSNGQQGKFEMCVGLSRGRDLILMDEPFFGKDIMTRQSFIKLLSALLEPQQILIVATHLIDDIKPLISRALVMKQGHLVADETVDQLHEKGISIADWLFHESGYKQPDLEQFLSDI